MTMKYDPFIEVFTKLSIALGLNTEHYLIKQNISKNSTISKINLNAVSLAAHP